MSPRANGVRPEIVRRKADPKKGKQAEQFLEDLRAVCTTETGRRVLWVLVSECRVWERIRAPNPDIHFLEGRRDVGVWLIELLTAADPTLIPLMMQEALVAQAMLAEQGVVVPDDPHDQEYRG